MRGASELATGFGTNEDLSMIDSSLVTVNSSAAKLREDKSEGMPALKTTKSPLNPSVRKDFTASRSPGSIHTLGKDAAFHRRSQQRKSPSELYLHERDPVEYIFGGGGSSSLVASSDWNQVNPKPPVEAVNLSISLNKRRTMRNRDQKLISQAGVYLNPSENCPVSKNLRTIKQAKRAIKLARN